MRVPFLTHHRQGPSRPFLILAAVLFFLQTGSSAAFADFLDRNFYGAKFEPTNGVLHGAGQTYHRENLSGHFSTAFDRYADVLGDSQYPFLFMAYNGFSNSSSQLWYDELAARLDAIEAADNRVVIPQLGTQLPNKFSANPRLSQAEIDVIVNGLASLNRPVYYRPGYEANGPWNNYEPDDYIYNFRALSDAIREADLPVAMVWNVIMGQSTGTANPTDAQMYYPGDEYVDWWSFNVFEATAFSGFSKFFIDQFLAQADAGGFPVMIGEATPRQIGSDSEQDWETWYRPFFELIQDNPGIKAHTYINWDWANTNAADGWQSWGDATLENADPVLRANYINELSNDMYIHATSALPGFLAVPEPSSFALVLLSIGLFELRIRSLRRIAQGP